MPDEEQNKGSNEEEGTQGQESEGASGAEDQGGEEEKSFEALLEEQPEEFKTAYEQHTHGLQTALQSEREERKSERDRRKELEKELRTMAQNAEEGSELRGQLEEKADALSEQEQRASEADARADFYEEAHGQGVTNLKLAYMAVTQDEIYDRKGNPDFAKLREDHPQLFGKRPGAAPAGDSGKGTGTGQEPPAQNDMNQWIREAAGRQ